MKPDTFTQAYIECALWSSTDENDKPLDSKPARNKPKRKIATVTLEQMAEDCRQFQMDNDDELATVASLCDDSRAGHDFWLNRNRHGSGFWDEYFGGDETLRQAFKRLDEASKAWGSFDLYVGDDGQIYGN